VFKNVLNKIIMLKSMKVKFLFTNVQDVSTIKGYVYVTKI